MVTAHAFSFVPCKALLLYGGAERAPIGLKHKQCCCGCWHSGTQMPAATTASGRHPPPRTPLPACSSHAQRQQSGTAGQQCLPAAAREPRQARGARQLSMPHMPPQTCSHHTRPGHAIRSATIIARCTTPQAQVQYCSIASGARRPHHSSTTMHTRDCARTCPVTAATWRRAGTPGPSAGCELPAAGRRHPSAAPPHSAAASLVHHPASAGLPWLHHTCLGVQCRGVRCVTQWHRGLMSSVMMIVSLCHTRMLHDVGDRLAAFLFLDLMVKADAQTCVASCASNTSMCRNAAASGQLDG